MKQFVVVAVFSDPADAGSARFAAEDRGARWARTVEAESGSWTVAVFGENHNTPEVELRVRNGRKVRAL